MAILRRNAIAENSTIQQMPFWGNIKIKFLII